MFSIKDICKGVFSRKDEVLVDAGKLQDLWDGYVSNKDLVKKLDSEVRRLLEVEQKLLDREEELLAIIANSGKERAGRLNKENEELKQKLALSNHFLESCRDREKWDSITTPPKIDIKI